MNMWTPYQCKNILKFELCETRAMRAHTKLWDISLCMTSIEFMRIHHSYRTVHTKFG